MADRYRVYNGKHPMLFVRVDHWPGQDIRKMNLIDIITLVMLISAEIRGWIELMSKKKEGD
ncbi:MAG TPA: hypothetical protein O0X51_07185 [Methanocorpusculum sp.]|nr:hypothetical protein [Methanocorpusculum sp.]HJK71664.1 hypothetical protein [Methanocorpusculum sp.]HJK72097.1 hypothetical protein [Methanocorpusculum sp.]HJK83769.1 hypothetical protein [Methanocorpusculum sp.]